LLVGEDYQRMIGMRFFGDGRVTDGYVRIRVASNYRIRLRRPLSCDEPSGYRPSDRYSPTSRSETSFILFSTCPDEFNHDQPHLSDLTASYGRHHIQTRAACLFPLLVLLSLGISPNPSCRSRSARTTSLDGLGSSTSVFFVVAVSPILGERFFGPPSSVRVFLKRRRIQPRKRQRFLDLAQGSAIHEQGSERRV
jgi:hypothetical protein